MLNELTDPFREELEACGFPIKRTLDEIVYKPLLRAFCEGTGIQPPERDVTRLAQLWADGTSKAKGVLDENSAIVGSSEVSLRVLEGLLWLYLSELDAPKGESRAEKFREFISYTTQRLAAPVIPLLAATAGPIAKPCDDHVRMARIRAINRIYGLVRGYEPAESLRAWLVDRTQKLRQDRGRHLTTLYVFGKSGAIYRALFYIFKICENPIPLSHIKLVDIELKMQPVPPNPIRQYADAVGRAIFGATAPTCFSVINPANFLADIHATGEADSERLFVVLPARLQFSRGYVVRAKVLEFLANLRPDEKKKLFLVPFLGGVKDCYHSLKDHVDLSRYVGLGQQGNYDVMAPEWVAGHIDR